MQKCDNHVRENYKERVINKRIDGINNELDYLNEEFDVIRNGVGNTVKITNEESQLR